MKRTIILVMLCALGLSACGIGQGGSLEGNLWKLQAINGNAPSPGETMTLWLANGSFQARSTGSPYSVSGTYVLNGSQLTFSPGVMPLTATSVTLSYWSSLSQVASYTISGNLLTLYNAIGTPILTFVP